MAAIHKAGGYSFSERRQQYEQNKPSAGAASPSCMHRHNSTDGVNLPSSPHPSSTLSGNQLQDRNSRPSNHRPPYMASQKLSINTHALGLRQQNGHFASPHSPTKTPRDAINNRLDNPGSTTKGSLATLSAKFSKDKTTKETSPKKPRSTNLGGLLSRPRSSKNLAKLAADPQGKNKENRRPSDPEDSPPTPIYAQFIGRGFGQTASVPNSPYDMSLDPFTQTSLLNLNNSFRPQASDGYPGLKQRPISFQPPYSSSKPDLLAPMDDRTEDRGRSKADEPQDSQRPSTWAKGRSISRARVLSAISSLGGQKSKSPTPPLQEPSTPQFNPQDIDKHLEAMLDRRNIPENQRYKMRNLNDTVKMEFVRQDWAESEGKNLVRPPTNESDDFSADNSRESVRDTEKKQSRGRSFTFSRNSWKIGGSPSKGKKKEPSVKGHARNKSADSTVSERPPSAGSYSSNGIMAKVTGQQPCDFVNYLRKVQTPDSVEVGKLHKLRLLLRNERVAWTEEFIKQGGMKEIVGLLHRIMEVEWR